jgi:hypothetical protein
MPVSAWADAMDTAMAVMKEIANRIEMNLEMDICLDILPPSETQSRDVPVL